jgi:hypothetical protein
MEGYLDLRTLKVYAIVLEANCIKLTVTITDIRKAFEEYSGHWSALQRSPSSSVNVAERIHFPALSGDASDVLAHTPRYANNSHALHTPISDWLSVGRGGVNVRRL